MFTVFLYTKKIINEPTYQKTDAIHVLVVVVDKYKQRQL